MGRYIVKIQDKKSKQNYYMEWSTIVDAPVTQGMSLENFTDHYRRMYGENAMDEFRERIKRVEAKGISAIEDTFDSVVKYNRAGENERNLSLKEIIATYCHA